MGVMTSFLPVSAVLSLAAFAFAAQATPATPPAERSKHLLVYTVSAGFEHDVVKRQPPSEPSLVESVLLKRAAQAGWFDVQLSRDAADFTPANLARFDAILFFTTGDLPFDAAAKRALFEFVRSGRGFVGVHSATDTFPSVPEYGELIGARFDGHPWHEAVRVRVAGRAHPSTRHLGDGFEITDEIYQFAAPYDRSQLNVLLELDATAAQLAAPGIHRTDGDFALAWTKSYGAGRVFYTALGHRAEVWSDERFLRHVEGGIAWAMRAERRLALAPELESYRTHALEHPGDAARGYTLFRQPTGPMCVRCHAVFGEGAHVGPDLSDVARKYDAAEIALSLLAPSERIAEGYGAMSVELTSGDMVFGQLANETGDELVLWDVDGRTRSIAKRDVVRRDASKTSLMPEGLPALVGREGFADLVAYLRTLRGAPK